MGPNGAGTTMLLSCVAALLSPLSGSVQVDGVDMLAEPRDGHRRIGYRKHFYGRYDSLSVRQTLWHAAPVPRGARWPVRSGERSCAAAAAGSALGGAALRRAGRGYPDVMNAELTEGPATATRGRRRADVAVHP